MSLCLRHLTQADEEQFTAGWGRGGGFTYYTEGVEFGAFLAVLEDAARGIDLPAGHVPSTLLVGDVDGALVGRLSIRHELNHFLATAGGHIGYEVLEPYRRRGYGTEMLRQSLPIARELGLAKVLVTCDIDNTGSRKIIEANGGEFDGTYDKGLKVPKLRYWIAT